MNVVMKRVSSVRNLMPSDTARACDPVADVKDRWVAFDRLFQAVIEDCKPHELKILGWPMPEGPEGDEARRQLQRMVAFALIGQHHQGSPDAVFEMLYQAEKLVPSPPHADTGAMPFTSVDQAMLELATRMAREEFPEETRIFYCASSEPVERLRKAFRTLYAMVGAAWQHESLKARQMTPMDRQRIVVMAFMCHVPKDQWTDADLEKLWAELLPVEEPAWTELDPSLA